MKIPQTVYATNEFFPGEVAVSVSFVPTFEPLAPQERTEVLIHEDAEPEQVKIIENEHLWFVFLLDRSVTMEKNDRMRNAKEALKLFLRSLPVGSKFSIISFGAESQFLEIDDQQVIDYNDETKQ